MKIKFNIGAIKVQGEMVTNERHHQLNMCGRPVAKVIEKETTPIDVELNDISLEVEDIALSEVGSLAKDFAVAAKDMVMAEITERREMAEIRRQEDNRLRNQKKSHKQHAKIKK